MEQVTEFDAFKSPHFDVNTWIRQTRSKFPEEADSEDIFAKLATELDKEISKTTDAINAISQQTVVQVPRVSKEFELIHKEVNNLQAEITAGFNEAENVQKKTTASMTTLERLDNVKTNLLATSSALQEADKWTSLGKEVEQLLDAGDVHRSYECIVGMEKSLSVLDQSTSEERRLILEEVKNRLEALATKHIIQAFETNHTENASKFFQMFSKLERTVQYIKYFENTEKMKLSQEWRNYIELMTFKDAIAKFYDDLLDHCHSKVQWCKTVFADSDEFASNVLLGLYAETVRQLEPSILYCFDAECKKEPFLELLLQFNQITHRFVQNLKQFIDSTCQVKPARGKVLELLKVLFAPFIPQYVKYARYHETIVVSKIQEAAKGSVTSGNLSQAEASTVIQERVDFAKRFLPDIVLAIKEREEKIVQLNQGYGYYHFGRGINAGLEKFRDWCMDIYRMLEKTSSQAEKPRSLLENSLSLAEACGEILLQVTQLDNVMTANCTRAFTKLLTPFNSEWEAYSDVYLDKTLLNEISQFLHKKETLLASSVNYWKKLCTEATRLILKVTADPIEVQLKRNFLLNDCNMKEAIPSEYITQVGEYLMLLPQNLDPFISSDGSSLSYAFEQSSDDETRSPVDYILSSVSVSICEVYSERLLKIAYLSDGQAKQLAQDIDYLASVLEDLGAKLTSDLVDFSRLMKIYPSISDNTNVEKVSTKILTVVKKMKHVPIA